MYVLYVVNVFIAEFDSCIQEHLHEIWVIKQFVYNEIVNLIFIT